MERRPITGELYRHFKNRVYQIIALTEHAKTGEELVVYQEMYGDFKMYVRPLMVFTGEVDHKKYPEAEQKYRFERVERETLQGQTESESVEPRLMDFLEADSVDERYNILVSMYDVITDRMIDTMAVVMDTVIPEGELFVRYEGLKRVLRTRQQYEFAHRYR